MFLRFQFWLHKQKWPGKEPLMMRVKAHISHYVGRCNGNSMLQLNPQGAFEAFVSCEIWPVPDSVFCSLQTEGSGAGAQHEPESVLQFLPQDLGFRTNF